MSSTATLYTTEVLAMATSLAKWPLGDDLALRGSARSPVCGSRIELGLAVDEGGSIERIGLKVHACAIGQASAAIFAKNTVGKDRRALESALASIEAWLADAGAPKPKWQGLEAIAAARGYPARHGAILLPWKAAVAALP